MIENNPAQLLEALRDKYNGQEEFLEAVSEVLNSVEDYYSKEDYLRGRSVLSRITEPDRIISFRVAWVDDEGRTRVNRGWRVQFNNALGPYKGGLRFHPSVNESILKFLAFEQIFKNALTGLPMGGGKGGSDLDPKGLSEQEMMRFCQAFMQELHRYIGPDVDVPAGDIGVGTREIGYLFGQYLRSAKTWNGALTGKSPNWGGSCLRGEATGYGCIYFLNHALKHQEQDLKEKKVLVSGAGNVALHVAEKALDFGAKVLTLSDSDGYVMTPDGLSGEQLEWIKKLKTERRGRISEAADEFEDLTFHEGKKPWTEVADIAIPCATQNELDREHAEALSENGVSIVCEGANMPVTSEAAAHLKEQEILHLPGKAANAGGVAVSGLELSQDAARRYWDCKTVDEQLKQIMGDIHDLCIEQAEDKSRPDYVRCSNLAAFKKVATAVADLGVI